MVRFKRRWLMVQVECGGNNDITTKKITRKDLLRTIRENIVHHFGQAATPLAAETQVRFWDPGTQLALIRTSREGSSQVRATLTLTTAIISSQRQTVALHIRSVHGSTRTVQRAAICHLQQLYIDRIRASSNEPDHRIVELCLQLEQHLQSIQQLE